MSQTVDAIQERLSPATIRDEVMDAMVSSASEAGARVQEAIVQTTQQAGRGLMSMIRENPVPALAAGAGIAWFAMKARNGQNGHSSTYRGDSGDMTGRRGTQYFGDGSYGDPSGSSMDTMSNGAAEGMTDRAQQLATDARDQITEFGGQARNSVQQAGGQFRQMLSDNPIAIGAAALAAGVAAGMLLPSTEREQSLLGDARSAIAQQVGERVSQVADQANDLMDSMEPSDQSSTSPNADGSMRTPDRPRARPA
ncbi:MAG: hypothetical protein U0360_03850 [Dehalococcoidia bacterium]